MKVRSLSLALALLASPLAHAIDDAAFARCRGIADTANRLACYDALPMNVTPAATQAPPIAAPKAAASAPAKAATPPPAAASAPAPAPQQQAAAQSFGYESRAPAVEPATTMESTIPGHFEGWGPNARIKLANGQVWQIADDSQAYFNLDNPKVVIRRGMMGGFFLEVENSNRSPRVRRVQ
jgi:hypothetical protein